MIRSIVAAVVGYAVWTAVWIGGDQVLVRIFPAEKEAFDAGGDLTATAPLLGYLVLSVLASIAAGWSTAAIATTRARGAVLVMALALLATGVAFQASVWSRMPAWYHLTFLALLVPVCLAAGRRRRAA